MTTRPDDRGLRAFTCLLALGMLVGACSNDGPESQEAGRIDPATSVASNLLPTVGSPGELPTGSGASGPLPTIEQETSDTVFVTVPSTTTTTSTTTSTTTTTTTPTTTTAPATTTAPPPTVPIPSDVLFETGKWVLRASADESLKPFAEALAADFPRASLLIVGHTDSRGSEASNLELSERRAQAVLEWFVEFGFERERLSARGVGESELLLPDVLDDGTFDEEAGQTNRRVEITVLP